ncbi:coiled-coil domain-containing protein 74B-like [Protobothrops mucrosquamatus]|uniref:coiled-coil domain-containing protein 74B-like n=1 Tax=Protobothrops mucrosquamatus TaxID=103944 RepID=UPI0010FAEE41|nr:coiled-coil domain-containing protein 74B-like [Protobothrops mucrosquamatus]
MQGSGFPPLGHLPHWPRAGQAERPGRPFALGAPGLADAPPPPPPPARRAAPELERSLQFLQQQHGETLRQLHQEVDRLKRRNQDLQYRLIMQPLLQQAGFLSADSEGASARRDKAKRAGGGPGELAGRPEDAEAPEQKAGEGEPLAEEEAAPEGSPEWERDADGLSPELQAAAAAAAPGRDIVAVCERRMSPLSLPRPSASQSRAGDVRIPAASSNPFLVNVLPSYMRKPPSLEECEVVIRQLWNINHMQMQELMYLRSCLDDIHKTKRIPEDYMLAGQLGAKADRGLPSAGWLELSAKGPGKVSGPKPFGGLPPFEELIRALLFRSQESTKLPRVRNAPKKCRILTPLPAAERAVLPALKQTLGNAFAERQKRAQAVQRNRLHRTAL